MSQSKDGLNVRGMFEKIHNQLLAGGLVNEAEELSLLKDIENELKERDDFVLGSFIYWKRDGNKAFWPPSDPPLFYSNTYSSDTNFTDKAGGTYSDLVKNSLFLSELIHGENQIRAMQIEMVHRTSKSKCMSDGHESSCSAQCNHDSKRAIVRHLDKLEDLFTVETKQANAKKYAEKIVGYFPDEANYLIVYCPFLVPNGKPPGSFFGVFKCKEECKSLLPLLTDIQLAGTLIFSRMAVDSKLERIRQEVDKLRGFHDSVKQLGSILSNIEVVMNPNYLLAGVATLADMKLGTFFDNNHDVNNWSDDIAIQFINLIKSEKDNFDKLQKDLPAEVFERCFGKVQMLLSKQTMDTQGIKNAGYIIKCIFKDNTCPLCWVNKSSPCNQAIKFKLNSDVSGLGFVLALNALGANAPIQIEQNNLKILITVSASEEGQEGLNSLLEEAKRKVTEAGLKLHDGHTSTALALLAKGNADCLDTAKVSEGQLIITFDFQIGVTN